MGTDGIAEDDGAGWTCQRSIGDWYLTILYSAVALLWTRNEARRVDHKRAHLKVPLAPARGSVLILG